eukprot:GHUV01006084.1.p1 GENE.GHUV01006084.1~~GHUV01006084.1.p1  ORF type:complete len:687 (+),score=64.20 GHUV01006084.1:529-2589(+)
MSLARVAMILLLVLRVDSQGLKEDKSSRAYGATSAPAAIQASYQAQWQRTYQEAVRWQNKWGTKRSAACRVSGLVPASGKLCGVDISSVQQQEALEVATSPIYYDSTNPQHTGGQNLITSARDQGSCHSCVAFAFVSAAETAMAAALQVDASSLQALSERDVQFCDAQYQPTAHSDCLSGKTFNDVLSVLVGRKRLIPARCLPYKADAAKIPQSQLCQVPSASCLLSVPAGTFTSTRRDGLVSIARVLEHIRRHGSVIAALHIPDPDIDFRDFFKSNPAGIYSSTDIPTATYGHAVALVGYNAKEEWFLAKNSWSSSFADKGFFRFKFGALGFNVRDPEFTLGLVWTPERLSVPDQRRLEPKVVSVRTSTGQQCYDYTVQRGDYIAKVAWRLGVPIVHILTMNGGSVAIMSLNAWLTPGIKLRVCAQLNNNVATAGGHASVPGSFATVADRQRAVLLGLKQMLSSPSDELRDWSNVFDYCTWKSQGLLDGHISCDDEGYITEIQILGSLKGSVADVFNTMAGNVPKLNRLVMEYMGLYGSLPSSLAGFPELAAVFLSGNDLYGTLPALWGEEARLGLTKLVTFSAGNNPSLVGPLPSTWQHMKLEYLLLSEDGALEGTIPRSWNNMKELKVFQIYGSKLSGCLPAQWKGRVAGTTWKYLKSGETVPMPPTDPWDLSGTSITGFCAA